MIYRSISLLFVLVWILTPILLTAQNQNSVQGDRQALVDLYRSANGDNWKKKSGWLNGNPSNSWQGIEVDGNGRVVKIDLRDNNLKGDLPSSIGNLSRVTYFNVKQNELTGNIPSSIGNMDRVEHLLLNGRKDNPLHDKDHHPGKEAGSGTAARSNNFTGSIPSSIGNLSNLQFFECIGKNVDVEGLSGPIPSEIGRLTNLIGLHLDFNDLTEVPESLGNLTNLVHLGLSVNQLGGGIPSAIGKLESLRYFRIGKNAIGGTIPDLSNLKDLRIFSSTYNELTGEIHASLTDGTLPRINIVSLAHNELTGPLPEFGNTNLAMFTVDNNNLEGRIPESISTQRRMTNLGLAWNNFEGEIPDLSQMHQLRYLRITDNNFTGGFPKLHPENSRLRNLWLGGNNLSGYIDPDNADVIRNAHSGFTNLHLQNNNFSNSDLRDFLNAVNSISGLNSLKLQSGGQRAGSVNQIAEGDTDSSAVSQAGYSGELSDPFNSAGERPEAMELHQNYPNPFNPTTQIQFSVRESQQVSLKVYDMAGRQIATLFDGIASSGTHQVTFNADNLASGIYFYRLHADNKVINGQMTFMK